MKILKKTNVLYIILAVAILCIIGLFVLKAVVPDLTAKSERNIQEEIAELNITQNPIAFLQLGDDSVVKIELYPNIAPNTVCNFIELANSGFYNGITFHRCIPGFMAQGGDPEASGMGGPGYSIKGEFSNNGFPNNLSHERGVISMARRSMPMDSAGSQFFIMVADNAGLDGDYAAFGKVLEGMEAIDRVVSVPTDENDKPIEPQTIKSLVVETYGVEYPKPIKIK